MRSFISAIALFVLLPATLWAQGTAVSGGLGLPLSFPGVTYDSNYSAPFLFGAQGTSRGTQVITLDRAFRPSVWGAVDWFPTVHAGLLVRGLFRRTPLTGSNTSYRVTVDYTASQPPDNVPRQYHYEFSKPWPDTAGHLDRWEVDALATFASASSGLRGHVDGGLAFVGTSGSFEPAGLTTFQLGGHSVLFSNEYELVLGVPRTWTVAAVASGGLTIPLGAHAGIDVSGRVLLPRTVSASLSVLSVGGDTAIASLTAEEAQRLLQPAPLELKVGTVEALVGIRFGKK